MKKIKLLLFVAGVTISLLASGQVPQLIDYQGMARDGSGIPMANTTIGVRMSVMEGPLPGTNVYSERHTPPTNSYGLFHLMIGDGTVLFGSFAGINWASGDYYIRTEIDPNGGSAYIDMGKSKVATVPFAFYAASSGGGGSSLWQQNGSNIYYDAGFVGIGTDSPAEALHIDAPGVPAAARISSTQSYFQADASGNTGLWMQEGGADVAWLYWNPPSQAVFMYENGNQTMTWKNNNVGVGTTNPLVKMQVIEQYSAGALGSALNLLTNGSQTLAIGVLGNALNNTSELSVGVFGQSDSPSSQYTTGVKAVGGASANNNYGLYGVCEGGAVNYSIAVYGSENGTAANNYAGYFSGNVHVAGTLSKTGGSFKIDHPQDPANKYLVHSFVESPDMMNIYNGNVVTDAGGMVIVKLPAYFNTLNIEFRYQLTVIGEFAQAIVKEEISGNQFTIMTDKPNVKVSWQVTGVRNDAWAQENRIQVEVTKGALEKGRYIHPELYGKSADFGLTTGVPHEARAQYKATPVKEKDPRIDPVQR